MYCGSHTSENLNLTQKKESPGSSVLFYQNLNKGQYTEPSM